MYDRKLTVLGLALLAVTLILYYNEDGEGFRYSYVTGIAMVGIFLASLIWFNIKHLGSGKK